MIFFAQEHFLGRLFSSGGLERGDESIEGAGDEGGGVRHDWR